MNTRLIPVLLLAGVTAVVGAPVSDEQLEAFAAHRSDLVRMTHQPQLLMPELSISCVAPVIGHSSASGVPEYYHLYVSEPGVVVMKTGQGTYPEGTVVLKEKFPDASANTTKLFTGMIKRQKGFNPEGGDWEYFVLSGDAKTVQARGTISSCVACHSIYRSTDFVSRAYAQDLRSGPAGQPASP